MDKWFHDLNFVKIKFEQPIENPRQYKKRVSEICDSCFV